MDFKVVWSPEAIEDLEAIAAHTKVSYLTAITRVLHFIVRSDLFNACYKQKTPTKSDND